MLKKLKPRNTYGANRNPVATHIKKHFQRVIPNKKKDRTFDRDEYDYEYER